MVMRRPQSETRAPPAGAHSSVFNNAISRQEAFFEILGVSCTELRFVHHENDVQRRARGGARELSTQTRPLNWPRFRIRAPMSRVPLWRRQKADSRRR
ncbi:hypothetical protein EVAR_28067_1 [Eumeta japonica]|uniref:Uncharacterized protein n=1 Tax=Eumeta variegata TaxID=151549 RepID=A0A4C1W8N2_EUMVA|nr:hypothetical protein EVAR_28067_1 [Eumeta japonica]